MESDAPRHAHDRGRAPVAFLILGTCLIGALVGGLYAPALHGDWVYDDPIYVAHNPHLQPFTWNVIAWSFTDHYQGNWHPITWLSHAVDLAVFTGPAGHHLVNIGLHAVNAALLFLALWRMTRCPWRSLAAAMLFAAHPIQVESVAWISERKNVLCLLFCLASLHAYLSYVDPRIRRRGVFCGLTVLALALALMSKQMAVTWPFVLLLLDGWPLRRIGPRAVVEKIPMLALVGLASFMAWTTQHGDQAVTSLSIIGWGARLSNAVMSYVRYLGHLFYPRDFSPYYPYPGMEAPEPWIVWVVGAAALLFFVTVLVMRQRQHRPYLLVGWLWFTGTLVPVIGLVQIGRQAMADRFAYLPMIGIVIAVVWLVADVITGTGQVEDVAHDASMTGSAHASKGAAGTTPAKDGVSRVAVVFGAGMAVAATASLCAGSYRQIAIWHDNESLWRRAVTLAPDASRPQRLLAVELATHDDDKARQQAIKLLQEAIPREKDLFENTRMRDELSNLLFRMKRYTEAIVELERLTAQAPANAGYRAFLAFNQERAAHEAASDEDRRKLLENARQNYLWALSLHPAPSDAADIHGRYANLLEQLGEPDSALAEYREALRAYPTERNCEALARLLDRMGRKNDAAMVRQQCAALKQQRTPPPSKP